MGRYHRPDPVLAERIRIARERAGLSQEKLAVRLGVSQGLVNAWENLNSNPSIHHIRLLSKELDVTADFLLGNDAAQETEAAWPEGWRVLHRAAGQLSPEKKRAVIDLVKAALALSDDDKNPEKPGN